MMAKPNRTFLPYLRLASTLRVATPSRLPQRRRPKLHRTATGIPEHAVISIPNDRTDGRSDVSYVSARSITTYPIIQLPMELFTSTKINAINRINLPLNARRIDRPSIMYVRFSIYRPNSKSTAELTGPINLR